MQVPLAITAFSSKEIESMGVKSAQELALMTPSFNMVNQNGGSGRNDRGTNTLTFRGLFLSGGGGLMFIDGAPVIGASAPPFADVERIEVLKGPQAAYFGRSTFVGAINFVIREPGDEFKGRLTAEYSSFGSNEETLSVESPVIRDKLAIRIGARHFARGGQYTNTANTSERLGSQDTKSVSGSIVFKPSDRLKIKAYLNYFRDSDGAPAQGAITPSYFNCLPGGAAAAAGSRASFGYYCGELPTVDKLPLALISGDNVLTPFIYNQVWNTTPSRWWVFNPTFIDHYGLERRAFQADVRIDYEFDSGWALSSTTAVHRDKTSVVLDSSYVADGNLPNLTYTPTNPNLLPNFNYMRVTQNLQQDFSQELRISTPQTWRLRGTVGANYLRSPSPGNTVFGYDVRGITIAGSITRSRPVTPAVFGGIYYDVFEKLTLSAEARYQWDKIKQIPVVGLNGNYVGGATATPLKNTFTSFSPRISVDYKFADNSTLYALFSRGYRPGGFNTALLTATPEALAQIRAQAPSADVFYLQEQLDNYEAGIKASFLENRARATLSVYYGKYLNGQAGASIPVRTTTVSNLVAITINTATATMKGYELEGEFQVSDRLKLSGNMALNDSKISTSNLALYNCVECINVLGNAKAGLGNRLPTVPKWTWSFSAQYTAPLTADYEWFGRVDYSHRGMSFTDYSAVAWLGASDNVNMRLGVRNERLSIEGFVSNLTQNKVLAAALQGLDVYTNAFPPVKNAVRFSLPMPRMFGARATYNF